MPVNPRYTAQEWQDIYAAQIPSPEHNPVYKKGTEPQPGKDLPHNLCKDYEDSNFSYQQIILVIIKYIIVCCYIFFLLLH